MFFDTERSHFFRPLVGKYREQFVECLRALYYQLYTVHTAEQGSSLSRDELIDIFQEALARTHIFQTDDESDFEPRFKNLRENASWILNNMLDCGWLVKQVDEALFKSTYAFTRHGRLHAEPFIQKHVLPQSRHRNTRGTYNALAAFANGGDVYDLIDAFDYSERIVADFTDIISELDERRRAMVREMESHLLVQKVSEEFFDFMEKRFQPDLSIRLSADSVEKYRDKIQQQIRKIKRKDKEAKVELEQELRKLLPERVVEGRSVLWALLEDIDLRIKTAAEIMVPHLRNALHGFTKRADIIIRQMSYLAHTQHADLTTICKRLGKLSEQAQQNVLLRAADSLASPQVRLLDPESVKVTQSHKSINIDYGLDTGDTFDDEARREIYIQQVLDQAFYFSSEALKQLLLDNLSKDNSLDSCTLSAQSAKDFLLLAHIVEAASHQRVDAPYHLSIIPLINEQESSDLFSSKDVFRIQFNKQ